MKKVSFVLASFAAVLALSSCQEQLTPRLSSKTMKANIKAENVVTKSSEDNAEFLGTIKGEGLQLDMFVSEGIMSSAAPVTKGQLYTTDNFGTAKVDAWLGQEVDGFNTHYINGGSIASNGDITANGETCYWLNEIPMNIWCYLPTDLELNTSAKSSATFNYNIADQKDIVVSYNNEMYEEGGDGTFDVTMKHALAGLRFDLRLLKADRTLTKVEIDGLNTSAVCTATNSGFVWSAPSSTGTFSYSENVTSVDKYLPKPDDDYTGLLFFMPQELTASSKISLTFTEEGKDPIVLTGSFGDSFAWKAGHTYTITIKASFYSGEQIIDIESGEISFAGAGDDKRFFSSLSPKALDQEDYYKLSFDFNMGNNQGGRITVALYKANTETLITTLFDRNAHKNSVRNPLSDENNSTIDFSFDNNSGNGSATIYFNKSIINTDDSFDIVYKYYGGNGGAALWKVSNVKLSIMQFQQ